MLVERVILIILLLVLLPLLYCNKTRPHFTKLDMLWLLYRRFGTRDRRFYDGSATETVTFYSGSATETAVTRFGNQDRA